MITKKRHPDAAKRGRLFETALMRLTQWWYENFEVLDYGHVRSRTFDQVQKVLLDIAPADDDEGEVVRSSKSLMKRALLQQGSRDMSAQLFTALCRALGIPTRLVVSLQSVPWQASVGKPKAPKKKSKKGKGKADASSDVGMSGGASEAAEDEEDDDMEEVSIPGTPVDVKGKGKVRFPGSGQTLSGASTPSGGTKEKALPKSVVRLRKSKSSGRRLGSKSSSGQSSESFILCILSYCL